MARQDRIRRAVALGLRTRSDTQKEPIAAIIGINMVDYYCVAMRWMHWLDWSSLIEHDAIARLLCAAFCVELWALGGKCSCKNQC